MSSPLGESTLVTDAKTAIKMVRDNLGDSAKVRLSLLLHTHMKTNSHSIQLIVYGHSMGTGVAARAVVEAEVRTGSVHSTSVLINQRPVSS